MALLFGACGTITGQEPAREQEQGVRANPFYSTTDTTTLNVPLAEWQRILSPQLYHVAFEKGTERPFTGKFEGEVKDGVFRCAVCGSALFDPKTKFESGTGWPSFYAPLAADRIQDRIDPGHGMIRDEVLCARCGAHLGHVFEDGPKPTGLRYCINAVSLDLGE
ncbi:MAG: peptide-methionine (R)-S-oxide reductase MsrB [Flavobacteriales bacterium]|nr:peptide-methionine (R)-S-oxide reductase MsrB [Flavobacteriales bacterium]